MKKTIRHLVYPLMGMAIGSMVMAGCNDDDDAKPGNEIVYGSVTDIDGHAYKTVVIGDQEWMAENLRVTKYNNGDHILTGLSDAEWSETDVTASGAYAINDHAEYPGIESPAEMAEAYGKLYNWYAVADARGLCPPGFRLPTDNDWSGLVDYLSSQGFDNQENDPDGAGNALKSCRQVGSPQGGACSTSDHPRWNSHNTHYGTDEYGFSALPGNLRFSFGSYGFVGQSGNWWSSTESASGGAWVRYIRHNEGHVGRLDGIKSLGLSVRCVRDAS